LIVDDNPDIRMLLVSVLQRSGHEVIEAADGAAVQQWVADTEPDLIVLDLMMPEVDGWDALEKLKADPSTKDIPVIIASALSEQEDLAKALAMGAIDYIPKPWDVADFVLRVGLATGNRAKSG
jgi:CheY-like chemotaxis protein